MAFSASKMHVVGWDFLFAREDVSCSTNYFYAQASTLNVLTQRYHLFTLKLEHMRACVRKKSEDAHFSPLHPVSE